MKEARTITERQEDVRRLNKLIEERDKNRGRFLEAVKKWCEGEKELITTFGIAQRLTAEIHELTNELRRNKTK